MPVSVMGGDKDAAFPNGTIGGMKLRDYFAAASLAGLLPGKSLSMPQTLQNVAEDAYKLADALLAARGE